jgi:hypothetical protein
MCWEDAIPGNAGHGLGGTMADGPFRYVIKHCNARHKRVGE